MPNIDFTLSDGNKLSFMKYCYYQAIDLISNSLFSTRDAVIISLTDTCTSIFGGFTVYSTIGHMAHKLGLPIDKVIQPGPSLSFVVYAEGMLFSSAD